MRDTPQERVAALTRLLLATMAGLVAMSVSLPQPARAQMAIRAERIGIEDADRILRSRVPSVPQAGNAGRALPARAQLSAGAPPPALFVASGCASSSTLPIEITTLASSLKCDPDLIFEYVYNNIEFEPLFGSNKGALGTLLDQRGDDIDQAQLFVALLNAAGITQTSYQFGYINVTGTTTAPSSTCTANVLAPAPGWLGVKNDVIAIATLLGNGGIPFGTGTFNGDGTLNCLPVAHVWVQVTLGGTNYVFDPSFKQHRVSNGLPNVGTVIGYSQSQFLADAGGTIDSVSISNINRAKLRSDLTGYANNLIGFIKGNNPAFTLNDIIGGKTIIPLTGSPIRQTGLPYLSPNQPSGFPENLGSNIPNSLRTCIAITLPFSAGAIQTTCANAPPTPATGCAVQTPVPGPETIVLFADQTYGQRITIFSMPDPSTPGNVIPTLLVNGAVPTTGINVGTSTPAGNQWAINVAITHPFANFTAANQCQNLSVTAGGSYLISAGWGQVGRGMVEKHRQLLAQAIAVPNVNLASEAVLGESLAVISYNWLAENAAQHHLGDSIGQVTTQYIHGVGITGQSAIQSTGAQGPYVDLPLNFVSITQQTCFPQTSCPFPGPIMGQFFTDSGTLSALESAVLEQTQAPAPNRSMPWLPIVLHFNVTGFPMMQE